MHACACFCGIGEEGGRRFAERACVLITLPNTLPGPGCEVPAGSETPQMSEQYIQPMPAQLPLLRPWNASK